MFKVLQFLFLEVELLDLRLCSSVKYYRERDYFTVPQLWGYFFSTEKNKNIENSVGYQYKTTKERRINIMLKAAPLCTDL